MLFEGQQLREMIQRASSNIELRNEYGRIYRTVSAAEAVALDLDNWIGIGNRRRLRFLRPRATGIIFNAGSRTTQRLKNEKGQHITHPSIREHRQSWVR